MASAGMQYVLNYWWIPVMPAVVVAILALVFNYVGDGLRSIIRGTGA